MIAIITISFAVVVGVHCQWVFLVLDVLFHKVALNLYVKTVTNVKNSEYLFGIVFENMKTGIWLSFFYLSQPLVFVVLETIFRIIFSFEIHSDRFWAN